MEWNGIERNGMEWSKTEWDVHACIPLYLLSHLIYLLLTFRAVIFMFHSIIREF